MKIQTLSSRLIFHVKMREFPAEFVVGFGLIAFRGGIRANCKLKAIVCEHSPCSALVPMLFIKINSFI